MAIDNNIYEDFYPKDVIWKFKKVEFDLRNYSLKNALKNYCLTGTNYFPFLNCTNLMSEEHSIY